MDKIRELNIDEIALVNGGGRNGADNDRYSSRANSSGHDSGSWSHLARNAPEHIYSSPSTVKCANDVFGGMIGGAIKGGVVGMARGTIGGAVAGQCLSNGHNGNDNGNKAGSSKCSGNSAADSCHW
ncbi:hypothetical protein ROM48_08110 [Cronobacter malonaticus]|uniref:hypothetical protein n=1 Tax=Cronobacter malonaticus TaxID=413503 RepID=UPI000CFB983D|nr:hypothetical protein [Cronobacter malonaticus]MDT3535975.1 hypothetical protein [Cronobacter malonaticus]